MFRTLFVLAIAVVLGGCASTKTVPIDLGVVQSSQPESILVMQRPVPDFMEQTPAKASLGLIGAIAGIDAGNELIEKNNVEDPAATIGLGVADALAKSLSLSAVSQVSEKTELGDVAELADAFSNADLLVDVSTINWSITYFPTDWTHYRLLYTAKLRIIDTKQKQLIAEGFCSQIPEDNDGMPTYDELTANNAAVLKQKVQEAAGFCTAEFIRKIIVSQG